MVRTGALSAATITRNQLLRPYPQYGTVNSNLNHTASSKYHSLQLKLERRFSRGMLFLMTYTAAKMIDNGSGRVVSFTPFRPPAQDQYNLRAERSVSQQDISQRLNLSHALDLPFGRGRAFLKGLPTLAEKIAGGWSAAGNAVWNTGFPLALTATGNSGVFSEALRPNSLGRSAKLEGAPQERLARYFDTSAFALPAAFRFGNVARTLPDVRGPGRVSYNLSLTKSTPVTERVSVLFRAEAFNLTNTPFFLPPAINLGAANFGVIDMAAGERQVQFTMRLVF
jgi:hypothetical protein